MPKDKPVKELPVTSPDADEANESVAVEVAPRKAEKAAPAPKPAPVISGTVWDKGPRTGGRYKLNEKGERVRVN